MKEEELDEIMNEDIDGETVEVENGVGSVGDVDIPEMCFGDPNEVSEAIERNKNIADNGYFDINKPIDAPFEVPIDTESYPQFFNEGPEDYPAPPKPPEPRIIDEDDIQVWKSRYYKVLEILNTFKRN